MLICPPSGPFNLMGGMGYETAFSQQIAKLRDAPMGIAEVATECETAGRRGAYPLIDAVGLTDLELAADQRSYFIEAARR